MAPPLDVSRIRLLRRVTRAVAADFESKLRTHLTTLAPLMHPRLVFGRHLRQAGIKGVSGEDAALETLQKLYAELVGKKPFDRLKALEPPLDIPQGMVEIHPAEYRHVVQVASSQKMIVIKSPLKWVLSFTGFDPEELQELASAGNPAAAGRLQRSVVHYLAMHVTLARRPGIGQVMEAMRFPLHTGRLDGCGELPVTFVESPLSTIRPVDELIVETTEISGTPEFEEILDLEQIVSLQDPLKNQIYDVAQSVGCDLPAEA